MIEAKTNKLTNVSMTMIIKHFFTEKIEPENVEKRNTSNNPFGDCIEFKGSVTPTTNVRCTVCLQRLQFT